MKDIMLSIATEKNMVKKKVGYCCAEFSVLVKIRNVYFSKNGGWNGFFVRPFVFAFISTNVYKNTYLKCVENFIERTHVHLVFIKKGKVPLCCLLLLELDVCYFSYIIYTYFTIQTGFYLWNTG